MRTKIVISFVAVIAGGVAVALLGCGGGGGGGGTTPAATLLTPGRASGRVVLPPGFPGTLSGMIVASGSISSR